MDNITGLAELQAALANLKADLSRQLPDIVVEAAGTVKDEIQSRMHVDSGQLEQSLEVVNTHRENSATATVQIDESGPEQNQHYAIYQEYGTSRMPAQPFFRPGVQAAKEEVAAKLINGVLNVVAQHDS